jgi:hypothetical protein
MPLDSKQNIVIFILDLGQCIITEVLDMIYFFYEANITSKIVTIAKIR